MPKILFYYGYMLILLFLALPMIKLFGLPRVEQLLVIFTFFLVFYDDLRKGNVDWGAIFFLLAGGILIALISLNSIAPKLNESNFLIKFVVIFPISFYVGARVLDKLSLREFLSAVDTALWFYVISWLVIMFVPLPYSILEKIVHLRDFGNGILEFLPFQGTFYEAGALGLIAGVVLMTSAILRYEFQIWPEKKYYSNLLYFLTLVMIIVSKNKTIWIAYVGILIFLIFYKSYLLLLHSNYYMPQRILLKDKILGKFTRINSLYLLVGALLLVMVFFLYNTFAPEPIINMKMLQFKMEHERGAQFMISWDLIERSNFFGGYGFGFVEAYFSHLNVMGVGLGSGSINNIILDMWLQGSIIAVIYLLGLFYISFCNRSYFTILIPVFFFVFGITNPIISEEFYLFLGISYSFCRYSNFLQKEGASAMV